VNQHKTTVSVVIPLYNKAAYIRRAVDSVLAQTYQDFELIVVDDGSTDEGPEIVAGYADPRLRLIRQANAGVSAARNRGVAEAQAELVAFLDADDEWRPWFLETVIGLRQRFPEAGAFATAYEIFDGERLRRPDFQTGIDNPEGGILHDYFLAACYDPPLWSSALMIPKRVFDKVGGFPVGVKRGEDTHTWTRIALYYPVAWSPRVASIYHREAENRACLSFWIYDDPPLAEPIEAFLSSDEKGYASRESVAEYLICRRLDLAKSFLERGDRIKAKRLLAKTAGTRRFRLRRLLLQFFSLLPHRLFVFLLRTRRFLSSRLKQGAD